MKQDFELEDFMKEHQARLCATLFMAEHNQLKARVQLLSKALRSIAYDGAITGDEVKVARAALKEAGLES